MAPDNRTEIDPRDHRVLILAPTSKDAQTASRLLDGAGITAQALTSLSQLVDELAHGAAAILIAEEALSSRDTASLQAFLDAQPTWSDLPVLILTQRGAASALSQEAVRTLGNVTLLERPLQVATLLSAVRTAWRSRQRQYQTRSYLAERIRGEETLRVADQRKDEFLATLGHELRNPLAPLSMGVELLKAAQIADPRVAQVTALMDRQIRHLMRLVDDLLEVSRITRGLIHIQHETVDLTAAVQSAIDTSRPVIESSAHTLRAEFPPEPITISGDAVRLTQVFSNLLTNSAKYTNNGGHIWLSVRLHRGRALVTIRDNGIGIPADRIESIFDMFTQVDRSNRRSQGGLGIGLTLVRSIVELHGGHVRAASAGPNQGSEFTVELPVVAEQSLAVPDEKPIDQLTSMRILVVDDNEDAADTLSWALKNLGADVQAVHSGAEALVRARSFKPHAAVLDIGMPGMDGYEVARQLRADPQFETLLLIALTGWSQDHDQAMARAVGFNVHIAKPPDLHGLAATLAAARPISSN